ncbi:MAG: hypothetical protein KF800_06540 [Lysobacter sp.]|nr:hypothetical protein [Lysobacter sp.]
MSVARTVPISVIHRSRVLLCSMKSTENLSILLIHGHPSRAKGSNPGSVKSFLTALSEALEDDRQPAGTGTPPSPGRRMPSQAPIA